MRYYLDTNKISQIDLIFENISHIMIDWTWITSNTCLIVYYGYIQKKAIWFWFYDGEKYEYIGDDLKVLRDNFWYTIQSFTVDGGKQIKKAIQEIYPHAKLQRCVTHIQRQIQNYISKYPKSECWKNLQKITTFESFLDQKEFRRDFMSWEKKYFDFLQEKSYSKEKSWYKHRRLRQARSHIFNALPYIFFHLKDANIKKSSNDLEWYFWVLHDQIYNHRWLKKERLFSFISLWIYNRNLNSN